MNIGSRLRSERKRLGMGQSEFSSIGGVKVVAQSNYETGKRVPDTEYLAAIAKVGADVQYIVTGLRSEDFEAVADDHGENAHSPMKQGIGSRLREVRERLKLSQAQVAEQVGVTRHTVMAWERGEQVPNALHMNAMLALGFDIMFVIGGTSAQSAGVALGLYADSWLAIDEAINAKKLVLSPEKKKQAADALYQASSGNVNTPADLADILARIAA